MIVPATFQQRVHYSADRESEKIFEEAVKQINDGASATDEQYVADSYSSAVKSDQTALVTMRDVLKEIKALFRH